MRIKWKKNKSLNLIHEQDDFKFRGLSSCYVGVSESEHIGFYEVKGEIVVRKIE